MLQIFATWLCTLGILRWLPIGSGRTRLGVAVMATVHAMISLQTSDFHPAPFPDWPRREVTFRGVLQKATKQLEDDVVGMESVAYHAASQRLFGGTRDGWIIEINVANFNSMKIVNRYYYGDNAREKRPLGMRFSPFDSNILFFLDAYQGIFQFHVIEKTVKIVYSVAATENNYFNDFDFLFNGDMIISQPCTTESDSKFHRIVLKSRPRGQLLRWSRTQNTTSVVAKGLYAPNGVQASPDRKSIFFAEMIAYRLNKLEFDDRSNEKPLITPLIEGLPGMPDNIRLMDDNVTLIVPLPEDRLELPAIINFSFVKHYMLWMYETFFYTTTPHIGDFAAVLFVHLQTGEIIDAWNNPSGTKIGGITQVLQFRNNVFVIGTDTAPCLFTVYEKNELY